MNIRIKHLILGAVAVSSIGLTFAAEPKPEEDVRFRQSAFNVIGRNFAQLGAIAKGERPYDQAFAVKTATLLEILAAQPFTAFGPGTDVSTHKADPKVWSDAAKFKDAAEKFQFEIAKLSTAAKDLDTLKLQVGAVGKTCKGCHDEFRVKDKK